MVCYVVIILTGASSSCSGSSGPIYVRPPGFKYHAQEITRPKIKKKKKVFPVTHSSSSCKTTSGTLSQTESGSILRKREPTPPKHRHIKRGKHILSKSIRLIKRVRLITFLKIEIGC